MKNVTGDGGKSVTLGQLLLILFAMAVLLAVIIIFTISSLLKDRAITELARQDARQVSELAFQSLYSAMSKGWTKEEIGEIVDRLNHNDWQMKIRVFRGRPVEEQFGPIPGEKAIVDADPVLREALYGGKEQLITHEDHIRYLYPVQVREVCLQCHTMAKLGDVNGAIEIVFPVQNLKLSLGFIVNVIITYFAVVMGIIFLALHLKLRYFVAKPIVHLVEVLQEITHHRDLTRRIPSRLGWVREIESLSGYFNEMLTTLQDYNLQLEEMAARDPLTKLYNRRKFEQFLSHEVRRAARHDHRFSLIMIDLDNFKHVNDSHGHPVGDLVLREVGMVLNSTVRDADVVARIGGDEFAIILPETDLANGIVVAEKLQKAFNSTDLEVPGALLRMSGSFGIVGYPENGESTEDLAIAMDVAMYKAKYAGKNRVATIERDEKEVVAERFAQAERIKRALDEDRVFCHFQPIVDVAAGTPAAYEALARIREGDTVLPAGMFIETIEELGLAEELDNRILEKGLTAKRERPELAGAKVFFNLSPKSFCNFRLMREMPHILDEAGVKVDEVVFEITEREALPHISELSSLLTELHGKGLRFALDDFGSGFSSFMYLKYLDVDYIKIKGSFVRHMAADARDYTLVKHIHGMAEEFGLKTIAEFVEDEKTHELLREMGIDYAQGYHYGKPREF